MRATINQVDVVSHLVGEDVDRGNTSLLPLACDDARLTRSDPDKHPGALADLARAAKLLNETVTRDFEPAVNGSHSDYATFSAQLESLAEQTSGARHAALIHAALAIGQARSYRVREIGYVRRTIAQLAGGLECENFDLAQASLTEQQAAEHSEADAISSVSFAGRSKPSQIGSTKPAQFKLTVTLTAKIAGSRTLGGDGSCGETGGEQGTAVETASFDPITVLPSGVIKAQTSQTDADLTGSWSASGTYYPENQCDQPTPFSCGGAFEFSDDDTASMSIDGDGAVVELQVLLPEVDEDGADSCPNPSDVADPILVPFSAQAIAQWEDDFQVPLDGLALRQHYDAFTIDSGIEPLGDPIPPADCTSTEADTNGGPCSNDGSGDSAVVTVTPVTPS